MAKIDGIEKLNDAEKGLAKLMVIKREYGRRSRYSKKSKLERIARLDKLAEGLDGIETLPGNKEVEIKNLKTKIKDSKIRAAAKTRRIRTRSLTTNDLQKQLDNINRLGEADGGKLKSAEIEEAKLKLLTSQAKKRMKYTTKATTSQKDRRIKRLLDINEQINKIGINSDGIPIKNSANLIKDKDKIKEKLAEKISSTILEKTKFKTTFGSSFTKENIKEKLTEIDSLSGIKIPDNIKALTKLKFLKDQFRRKSRKSTKERTDRIAGLDNIKKLANNIQIANNLSEKIKGNKAKFLNKISKKKVNVAGRLSRNISRFTILSKGDLKKRLDKIEAINSSKLTFNEKILAREKLLKGAAKLVTRNPSFNRKQKLKSLQEIRTKFQGYKVKATLQGATLSTQERDSINKLLDLEKNITKKMVSIAGRSTKFLPRFSARTVSKRINKSSSLEGKLSRIGKLGLNNDIEKLAKIKLVGRELKGTRYGLESKSTRIKRLQKLKEILGEEIPIKSSNEQKAEKYIKEMTGYKYGELKNKIDDKIVSTLVRGTIPRITRLKNNNFRERLGKINTLAIEVGVKDTADQNIVKAAKKKLILDEIKRRTNPSLRSKENILKSLNKLKEIAPDELKTDIETAKENVASKGKLIFRMSPNNIKKELERINKMELSDNPKVSDKLKFEYKIKLLEKQIAKRSFLKQNKSLKKRREEISKILESLRQDEINKHQIRRIIKSNTKTNRIEKINALRKGLVDEIINKSRIRPLKVEQLNAKVEEIKKTLQGLKPVDKNTKIINLYDSEFKRRKQFGKLERRFDKQMESLQNIRKSLYKYGETTADSGKKFKKKVKTKISEIDAELIRIRNSKPYFFGRSKKLRNEQLNILNSNILKSNILKSNILNKKPNPFGKAGTTSLRDKATENNTKKQEEINKKSKAIKLTKPNNFVGITSKMVDDAKLLSKANNSPLVNSNLVKKIVKRYKQGEIKGEITKLEAKLAKLKPATNQASATQDNPNQAKMNRLVEQIESLKDLEDVAKGYRESKTTRSSARRTYNSVKFGRSKTGLETAKESLTQIINNNPNLSSKAKDELTRQIGKIENKMINITKAPRVGKTATRALAGTALGALVGGPIGAAVGAGVGVGVGATTGAVVGAIESKKILNRQSRPLNQKLQTRKN